MLKQAAAVIIACSALTIVGCSSSDDPVDPVDTGDNGDGGDNGEGGDNGTSVETAGIYRISFTNLTGGQPMTPPVVAIHGEGTHLFQIGTEASIQLQEIAENGNNTPMVELTGSLATVTASGVALVDASDPGPFLSGETASVILQTDAADQVLSAVNMIVCTNDGFSGADSLALPTGSEPVSIDVLPYDAGTELNELDADYWVAPCGGSGENLHEDENGVTGAHEGQTGTGDFDFVGADPVLRIEVERISSTAGTYEIAFTNLSTGQPMTPPVAVIHDSSVNLYKVGSEASTEVQEIAENGNNAPMEALVGSLPEVSASGLALVDSENPGPVMPGETATVMLETDAIAHVFSAVNMIVCTNDGFTGINSTQLPTDSETLTFDVLPYDAGTELNEIDLEYWVAPCGGSGANLHDDEGGVIAAHPGQTGIGNFNFVGTDAIMQIAITRQDTETGGGETGGGETGGGETGGGEVSENAGAAQAALESAGTFTSFIASFAPQSFDDPVNVWTVFAPLDASIPDGVTINPQNHIFVGGALTAEEMLSNGEITTNNGNTYAVTGTESALMVDGNPVSFLATGDGGALVYSIEGVLE